MSPSGTSTGRSACRSRSSNCLQVRTKSPAAKSSSPKRSSTLKLPQLVEDREASDSELRDLVASYYHATLKESPSALEYLESRGLRSAEMVERFQLGFSNRTLGYHLPQRNRQAGQQILLESNERSRHSIRLRERVILPLVIITLLRALSGRFTLHRNIARWTLPLWLYVSVTGVVIYVMLYGA